MAIPDVPQKRLMAAGIRRGESSWGTALALGAGYGVLLESDGGLNRTHPYLPANEADSPMALEGDLGPHDPVVFAPGFAMRYDPGTIGTALALLFGIAGDPTDNGNGAYGHQFQWADDNYGLFLTFALEKLSKIYEVPSAKPTAFDLSVADGLIKGTISLVGDQLKEDSSINTLTQMDALTYADRGNRMKFSQTVFKMNNQSAGNAAAESALEISNFNLHLERPHDSPHKAGSNFMIEPAETGASIMTIELMFPRMSSINNAYFADFKDEVEKKLDIKMMGAIIGGPSPYAMHFKFPRLRVIEVEYTWDEIIPARIKLQAEEAASAPEGMDYTRVGLTFQNTRSTDYLT